jgi:hypothetical protein
VVRYAFTAEDFHLIPPAGLPAHPSTPSHLAFLLLITYLTAGLGFIGSR